MTDLDLIGPCLRFLDIQATTQYIRPHELTGSLQSLSCTGEYFLGSLKMFSRPMVSTRPNASMTLMSWAPDAAKNNMPAMTLDLENKLLEDRENRRVDRMGPLQAKNDHTRPGLS